MGAAEHRIDAAELHRHPALRDVIAKHVETVNGEFARVEGVKKFRVLSRNLTIEDGELTPTLKVKRKIVCEHFAPEIDAMYEEDDEAEPLSLSVGAR